MVKTRAHSRKMSSARRSYRRRVKASHCRGKGPAVCRGTSGCKYASGRKRSFCRKSKVTRRRRRGGMQPHMPHHKKHGGIHPGHHTRKNGGKRKKGGSMLSKAVLPFGLFGLKHLYDRRRRR